MGWDWPSGLTLAGIIAGGYALYLFLRIAASLEAIRVDLNIMEHRSRAQEDSFASLCADVSEIQRSGFSIASDIDSMKRRAAQ